MRKLLMLCCLIISCLAYANKKVQPPKPLLPLPSQRQLDWMKMEMNAFVHFTINSFTDLEWGRGDEQETLFNPTSADPMQWTTVLKNAGFKGLIFTAKHHDGFCLWPSTYSEHTIHKSPYEHGNGDLVRETSSACRKTGIKFGVYLSPWDRNRADYGKASYINYYRSQLTELISNYGPIFELWFDGANGGTGYYGGANENRKIDANTYYDWFNTIKLARSLQKSELSIFSDTGPDIRWVGNEKGYANKTNWNMITPDSVLRNKEKKSEILASGMENGSNWIPAEVDVSIRPGWFYHAKEDSLVKSAEQLFQIYLNSVGRGAVLLLNIPPDRRGLFHDVDVQSLNGLRKIIDREFKTNIAKNAKITVSATRGNSSHFGAENLNDDNPETYWTTDNELKTGVVEIDLRQQHAVNYLIIKEYLKLGQRIKAFNVEMKRADKWIKICDETTIGNKRILKIDPVITDKIRINITDARACPIISEIEVY